VLNGFVVVDKESGWTSHDVVARCRGIFGQRRIGHAGTLDPDATGVLLVGLGSATRLLRFASALGKCYIGEIKLGTTTSTLDAAGEVLATRDFSQVEQEDVRREAIALTGRISQIPPMVSAVKVGGRRLHELARAGIEVERQPRPVTVSRFEIAEPGPGPGDEDGVYRFAVECSSGTYVRVLAADLGEALGCGAHLRSLRRTAIGSFTEDEAMPLAGLAPGVERPVAQLVRDCACVVVEDEVAEGVRHGRVFERGELAVAGDGPWAVLDGRGELLAMYEINGPEKVKPALVMPER
jgi:tRNA pseudouridine55 synthase